MKSAPFERLLLAVQSTSPGGMETHCVDLAAEFGRRGVAVTVVLPEPELFDPLSDRFRLAGAAVVRLETTAYRGRRAQLRRVRALFNLMRDVRPDVVHLHTGGATGGLLLVLVARFGSSARVVVTEHDVPSEHPQLSSRLSRFVLDRLAFGLVAVSQRNAELRRSRLGVPVGKLVSILNGVPILESTPAERRDNRGAIRSRLGLAADAVVIGSLVRLAAGKGLDDLVRAFAIVLRAQPSHLVLVGEGPLRAEIEAQAREMGVAQALHLVGNQAQPLPYLDAMDVFALAVPAGSMSIALLEAMARGLPPVITFCGPEEAVIDGQTGLCAPPNDPEGLASVLIQLVADPRRRAELGKAAARHVRQQFSVGRVADDLVSVYGAGGAAKPTPQLGESGHRAADAARHEEAKP